MSDGDSDNEICDIFHDRGWQNISDSSHSFDILSPLPVKYRSGYCANLPSRNVLNICYSYDFLFLFLLFITRDI